MTRPAVALAALFLAGTSRSQERPVPAADAKCEPLVVTQAVQQALYHSPSLLDTVDTLRTAEANLAGVRSQFLPQVNPYFNRANGSDPATPKAIYGVAASQQFTFGPLVTGRIDAANGGDPVDPYTSRYAVAVEQPFLRGLDPVVTREPLRNAERQKETQSRQVDLQGQQTVVAAWQAYLNVVLAEELVGISRERVVRVTRLVAASEAKMKAGSASRLDVLRSEQLLASAQLQVNLSVAAAGDAHEALGRLMGRPPGTRFAVHVPDSLPVAVPDEPDASANAREYRLEVLEQKSRVRDAEIVLRIARSNVLPSLNGFAAWTAGAAGSTIGASFTPGSPTFSVGFRSTMNVNLGQLLAAKTAAEVSLRGARRTLSVVEDDVVRAVAQSARSLRAIEANERIQEANLEVAWTQLEVANLRFEKGFIDNFQVVDSEESYNSARVAAISSRNDTLIARLNYLLAAALLVPADFMPSVPGGR
jgi:outer membrane protein TolC